MHILKVAWPAQKRSAHPHPVYAGSRYKDPRSVNFGNRVEVDTSLEAILSFATATTATSQHQRRLRRLMQQASRLFFQAGHVSRILEHSHQDAKFSAYVAARRTAGLQASHTHWPSCLIRFGGISRCVKKNRASPRGLKQPAEAGAQGWRC